MRTYLAVAVLSFSCGNANAGFFDDMVNEAKQATGQIIVNTMDSVINGQQHQEQQPQQPQPAQASQPAAKSYQAQAPAYDKQLVRDIQTALNEHGYNTGKPDGLYGKGTRKAISAYQKDKGLAVDGKPSATLLASLQQAPKASADAGKPMAPGSNLPEPTLPAMKLAAVHYRPDTLDSDNTLRYILVTAHREYATVVTNEFQWRKRKSEFKQQMLAESAAATLEFEAQPWHESSISKLTPYEFKTYDFDKQAFRTWIYPQNLIPGGASLPRYPHTIGSLPLSMDKAEAISNYFGNKKRQVFARYRFKVVGADTSSGRPEPIVEFDGDRVEFYAREIKPQGNTAKTTFKHLVTVTLPVVGAKVAAAPVKPATPAPVSAGKGGAVRSAELGGVRLGMPIAEALDNMRKHGIEVAAPLDGGKSGSGNIKGQSTTPDGAGWIKYAGVYKDGVVYQFQETVGYLGERLPLGDGTTAEQIEQHYRDEFNGKFSGAPYTSKDYAGRQHYDDESRAEFSGLTRTPHAYVLVGHSRGGRISAMAYMEWKKVANAK
jgi:hypothetical protein